MTRRVSVRERWYSVVIRTRLVTGPCRELLSLMAVRHMSERGYVQVPREQLADELDIRPHRISVLIGQATKAGLLVKVGGGFNGQVTQYAAQLPPEEGCPERTTFSPGRFRADDNLQRQPSGVVVRPRSVAKVVASGQPYVRACACASTSRTAAHDRYRARAAALVRSCSPPRAATTGERHLTLVAGLRPNATTSEAELRARAA